MYSLFIVVFLINSVVGLQSKLTIDDFFNGTAYPSVSLSPNGQYVLASSRRASWDSNNFANSLWLYKTSRPERKKLITNELSELLVPKWSPTGKWFLFMINEKNKTQSKETRIQLYNVESSETLTVELGKESLTAVTWTNEDATLYFATVVSKPTGEDPEWKDVIRYGQTRSSEQSRIQRIEIKKKKQKVSVEIRPVHTVNFLISEMVYSSSQKKLILNRISPLIETVDVVEIYSVDLKNVSSLKRLTNNGGAELNVQISKDGRSLFFQIFPLGSKLDQFAIAQPKLYSINLANGRLEQWAKDFDGSVLGYALRSEGGVYFIGQKSISAQIYVQNSPSSRSILQRGWNGTYESLSASTSGRFSSLAFVHTAAKHPAEVYFVRHVDNLRSARALTHANEFLADFDLPQISSYRWTNKDDNRTIEGILHYPPGHFEGKNLPLLVLIHGGPASASLDSFHPDFYTWAPLAASEGWLVLEPNYRGSIGYGEAFVAEVRREIVSRPGKDILDGVDQLIIDGIADPTQLAVGGYSYGGYLTNWLITRTTRFNAALSGAGAVDQASNWGLIDFPAFIEGIIGGLPWEIPQRYLNESAIYQMSGVRTPTHIITGANDVRVPISQSYILERSLHNLGVPTELLIFPNEDHGFSNNPWHGKIKTRQELKWLEKYGHTPVSQRKN